MNDRFYLNCLMYGRALIPEVAPVGADEFKYLWFSDVYYFSY